MTTTITIPLPPSTNALFATVRGRRIKSREYESWIKEAGWAILAQRPKPVMGDVSIHIVAGRPNKRRDLDNLLKATLDLLVKMGTISDDKHIQRIVAEWTSGEPKMTVTISPLPAVV